MKQMVRETNDYRNKVLARETNAKRNTILTLGREHKKKETVRESNGFHNIKSYCKAL